MNKERFTCDWIFNILVVLCDGKVVCGCADPNGERPLGHLKENSLCEIWNSRKVKEIRQNLNQGYSRFCLDCGLKRRLSPDEEITERPVHQEVLPRIFFEPTILCNISCFRSVCSKESGIIKTRERKYFPYDEFKSLMDEVGSNLIRLDFFNYGESFVHPQAVDMVEYIKRTFPQIYLYISTNGLILDSNKTKRIIRAGVDEITFSVDGADQETYVAYRRGGDFSKVLKVMSDFVEERNNTGREVPFINWRYILFRWNDSKRKMNAARKLAEKIGIDRLTWEITDHPQEAVSRKYQIGSRACKKIYYEIWDTSQVNNAIKSKRWLADIHTKHKAIYASAGCQTSVEVKVRNKGGALWHSQTYSGRRIARLGAQLFDTTRNLIDLNYARAFLPHNVRFGESVNLEIELPLLKIPGSYWLKFDMVSEGIDWFESAGSKVVWKKYYAVK
ncbi:MAG: radical SAM protein [Candidatus Aminicenantaceae bacterium]